MEAPENERPVIAVINFSAEIGKMGAKRSFTTVVMNGSNGPRLCGNAFVYVLCVSAFPSLAFFYSKSAICPQWGSI